MDFTDDLNHCLVALKDGKLVGIPGRAGWMLAGNATDEEAMLALMKVSREMVSCAQAAQQPVILLAEERELVQYVSALDLSVFTWINLQDDPFAIWFDGIIGLADCILSESGAAPFSFVKDDFNKNLIKRFRLPLAGILVNKYQLPGLAAALAQEHTTTTREGFIQKKTFNY